jgi:hypothetical protein
MIDTWIGSSINTYPGKQVSKDELGNFITSRFMLPFSTVIFSPCASKQT